MTVGDDVGLDGVSGVFKGRLVAEGAGTVAVKGTGVEVGSTTGVDAAGSAIAATDEVEFTVVSLVCVSGEQAVPRNPDKTPNNRIPLMKDFMPRKDLPGPQASFLFAFQFCSLVFPGQSVQKLAPARPRTLPGHLH